MPAYSDGATALACGLRSSDVEHMRTPRSTRHWVRYGPLCCGLVLGELPHSALLTGSPCPGDIAILLLGIALELGMRAAVSFRSASSLAKRRCPIRVSVRKPSTEPASGTYSFRSPSGVW